MADALLGQRVLVSGLQTRPELNGTYGRTTSVMGRDRYGVVPEGGGEAIAIKAENLSPALAAESVVFVTRHGARIDNSPTDRDANWLKHAGHSRRDDPHLSPHGERAAAELAAKLKAQTAFPIAHVVSSPFVRCMQTADAVARALDLPIKVEPGICEVLHAFPPRLAASTELAARWRIDDAYTPVVGVSDLQRERSDGEAARRSQRAAEEVRRRLDGPILFVGHGASCLGLVRAFGDAGGYVGYCTVSRFELAGGRWTTAEFNDVGHLSDKRTALDSAW